MLAMLTKYDMLRYAAAVITDHDHMVRTPERFRQQCEVADAINSEYGNFIPLIVGLEIQLGWGFEAVLLGRVAIQRWLNACRVDNSVPCVFYSFKTPKVTPEFFDGIPYALILAHPSLDRIRTFDMNTMSWGCFPSAALDIDEVRLPFSLVHGFERTNRGVDIFSEDEVSLLERKFGIRSYRSSDAHDTDLVGCCHTDIDVDVNNEGDLVRWVRSGRVDGNFRG